LLTDLLFGGAGTSSKRKVSMPRLVEMNYPFYDAQDGIKSFFLPITSLLVVNFHPGKDNNTHFLMVLRVDC
jgi:hypothetical protein